MNPEWNIPLICGLAPSGQNEQMDLTHILHALKAEAARRVGAWRRGSMGLSEPLAWFDGVEDERARARRGVKDEGRGAGRAVGGKKRS